MRCCRLGTLPPTAFACKTPQRARLYFRLRTRGLGLLLGAVASTLRRPGSWQCYGNRRRRAIDGAGTRVVWPSWLVADAGGVLGLLHPRPALMQKNQAGPIPLYPYLFFTVALTAGSRRHVGPQACDFLQFVLWWSPCIDSPRPRLRHQVHQLLDPTPPRVSVCRAPIWSFPVVGAVKAPLGCMGNNHFPPPLAPN